MLVRLTSIRSASRCWETGPNAASAVMHGVLAWMRPAGERALGVAVGVIVRDAQEVAGEVAEAEFLHVRGQHSHIVNTTNRQSVDDQSY